MAIYLLEKSDDYRLGIWKMDEDETELLKCAGLTESPALSNPYRRREFLAVRVMAYVMSINPGDIAYLPSGKPYLTNQTTTISISHTKNYVAVLLSHHVCAGVDIEQRSDRILKVRHKFMHPDEENVLKQSAPSMNETDGLLLHWCAKESLFKAVSEVGIDFAQELRISGLSTLDHSGKFKGCFLRTCHHFQIDYQIHTDFVLTCSFSSESK